MHRIGRTGRVGRTGRAITFVTPAQRDEIARIERDVKTSIGEWETPEERLEHAPRPRRRERERSRAASRRARDGAAGERRRRPGDGERRRRRRSSSSSTAASAAASARRTCAGPCARARSSPRRPIHDVRVLHRFSFVEVDPDQAERAVEFLDGTKLKGKEIRLEIAKS